PSLRLARDSSVTSSRAGLGATQCSRFVSQIVPTDIQFSRRTASPPPASRKAKALLTISAMRLKSRWLRKPRTMAAPSVSSLNDISRNRGVPDQTNDGGAPPTGGLGQRGVEWPVVN